VTEHKERLAQLEDREGALAVRMQALDAREASLADLAAEQNRQRALEHELVERNGSVERRAQLADGEGTLAERMQALAEQADQLAEQEAALARAVEERTQKLAGREAALETREVHFADRAAELRALEQELVQRNEDLEWQTAELTEHEARFGRRIRRYTERGYADAEEVEVETEASG
jgi:hypothetical protein